MAEKFRRPESKDDKGIGGFKKIKAKLKSEAEKALPGTEIQEEVVEVVGDTGVVAVPPPVKPERERRRAVGKRERDAASSDFLEKVITIKRVTKVTKGGKKLSFSALVVVGDMKGRVGYSLEKAKEVAIAIKKSLMSAKKRMIVVPLKGTTIAHEIIGQCGGARVLLKPAGEGTGVIAAGPVRAVCDGAGIRNILTKCHRSNNPINVVKATFDGLSRLKAVNNNNRTQEAESGQQNVSTSN
jgi:small subunit ribosomal protein S5